MLLKNILSYLLVLFGSTFADDPVYTPATLSDSAGNSADSSSTITWADLPSNISYSVGDPERVSEGLAPYYNLVHGFIEFVFLKGIPTDIVEKAANGSLGDIPSNYNQYIPYLIGYGICVAIGFLFILIFPIVACCFCCCRCCCGKCGGRMHQSEKDAKNSCRKCTYSIALGVILAFAVTGAVCVYVNNDNTSDALNGVTESTNENIYDLKAYVNNTVQQVRHIGTSNFNFLKDALYRDLDNIAYLVGLPLRTDIETNTGISTTLTNAYTLNSDINTVDTGLADVESKVTDLNTSLSALNTALSNWKTGLDSVFSTCAGSCTSQPSYNVETGVDSSQLPDLSSARSSMDSFTASNLTQKIVDAETELDNIPETVANDSLDTRNSLKSTIANLSDEIDPVIDEVENMQDLVNFNIRATSRENGSRGIANSADSAQSPRLPPRSPVRVYTISGENATIDLDEVSEQVEDFGDTIRKYDKYRWQGGVGLACLMLFVILLAGLGLAFGILGSCEETPPSKRGFVSNVGGILLMASVGFVCIFSALLMLLTTLTFILGAPVHAVLCKPITDLDSMEELWTVYNDAKVGQGNYYLGDVIHSNKTIALTLTGILRDCKAGKSSMSAFRLDTQFDLNDLLNYSKTLDVQQEIDAVNVNFDNVEVYPASLQTQLSDAKNALDVNFTAFYTELNKNTTTMNLSALADDLDTYADSIPGPHKTNIKGSATNLRTIETTEYADTVSKVDALNTSVANLETAIGNIPSQIDALDSDLNATDTYIKNNASGVVRSLLNSYADRLLGIVDSFKNFTLDAIENKMGSCSPVWNAYNSMLVYTFCYNIMDTFNGFWFSLGWCIFFFMPGIIVSVKLAKYFRRMNDANSNRVSPEPEKLRYPPGGPVVDGNALEDATVEPANEKLASSTADLTHPPNGYGIDEQGDAMSSVYVVNDTKFVTTPPNSLELYGQPKSSEVALEVGEVHKQDYEETEVDEETPDTANAGELGEGLDVDLITGNRPSTDSQETATTTEDMTVEDRENISQTKAINNSEDAVLKASNEDVNQDVNITQPKKETGDTDGVNEITEETEADATIVPREGSPSNDSEHPAYNDTGDTNVKSELPDDAATEEDVDHNVIQVKSQDEIHFASDNTKDLSRYENEGTDDLVNVEI